MDKMKILELEHVQKMTAVNVRVSIPLQIEIEKKKYLLILIYLLIEIKSNIFIEIKSNILIDKDILTENIFIEKVIYLFIRIY